MLSINNKLYKEDEDLFSYNSLKLIYEEKNDLTNSLNEYFYDYKKSSFSFLCYRINKRKEDFNLYESNFNNEKLYINDLNRIKLIKRKEYIKIKKRK